MNPLFDEALSFVSDTVRRFYAGTGIEQVVERFSDDLSWIGAGEVEFSTSAEEIVSYLTKRAPLAPPCEVFDEEFYLVNVTECSCTVMGRYNVRTREDSQLVIEERQRCSYELVGCGRRAQDPPCPCVESLSGDEGRAVLPLRGRQADLRVLAAARARENGHHRSAHRQHHGRPQDERGRRRVHAVLRQRGSGAHARLHHRRADGGERAARRWAWCMLPIARRRSPMSRAASPRGLRTRRSTARAARTVRWRGCSIRVAKCKPRTVR